MTYLTSQHGKEAYKEMQSPLTDLTEGDFTSLRVLSSAVVMTDILTPIGSGGGGDLAGA